MMANLGMHIKRVLGKVVHSFFTRKITIAKWQFNLALFTAFVVGIIFSLGYLTNSYLLPKIFAFNDTTQTWTLNTANASQYTYDNTLVTIDNTGVHPITGVNKLTNPSFTSDNSSWALTAVNGSTTPTGWAVIPGNSTYSTTDFLAMKYDAKCDINSDGLGDVTASGNVCNGSLNVDGTGDQYGTYRNNGTGCSCTGSKQVVSTANGFPIAYINQTDSATYCSGVTAGGAASHLITNNEWMVIARNAELQNSNWCSSNGTSCGNAPGTAGKILASGHNDNNNEVSKGGDANSAIVASTDDSQACYGTTTDGSNTCGGTGSQKRTLALSNGSVVWDIGGNVYNWTNNTIQGADKPVGNTAAWVEWTTVSNYGTLSYDLLRPSVNTYNSTQGVGQYYEGPNTGGPFGFLRGGRWTDGSGAGPFAQALSYAPTTAASTVGFRCASGPVAISQSNSSGGRAGGAVVVNTGALTDGKFVQSVNVGDTSTYDFSVYVYDQTTGNVGGTVSSSIAQLYYNGQTITTIYADAGSGWWKLSGTLTGANAGREYGLLVKSGKTIKADDFTLSKSGTYSVMTTTAYSNASVHTWDSFTPTVTASGNASVVYQLCPTDGSSCDSGNNWQYYTGSAWATATDNTTTVNTAAQLTQAAMQAFPTTNHKIAVKAIMLFGGTDTPVISSITIGLTTDTTPPTVNASSLLMQTLSSGGLTVASNGWDNSSAPYFSWTAGADNTGGTGLKGYCLYLGTDSSGDPATSKGLLGTSPLSTTGTTCQFIVSSTSIDFATLTYQGSPWLTTSNSSYYLNIKAIDNSGNIYTGSAAQFQFRFDATTPTNVTYISPASGNFSNVADMSFSWPVSGGVAASDVNSGVLGYQYQINSTSGTWLGTTTDSTCNMSVIPAVTNSYQLTQAQDGASIVSGANVVYFRTVDTACNISASSTYRTGNISYGGAAPSFGGNANVSVTPSSSTSNSFALSWPAATATSGKSVTHYYYMVNTSPPSTLATLQGNAGTYIDNGTTRTVAAAALPGVNKGTNTVYVVAVDNASTPNYSPSNYISGTFTLNSTNPDPVQNLVASDSSIKSQSQWNITLTWTAPAYQGAGNLTYMVYRSTDNSTFSKVGSTSGLSYVNNTPSSTLYYYYVVTQDGANAQSAQTNAVSITPTGRYTSAPSLQSGPSAGSTTTKQTVITFSTDRNSDSKIEYGTSSGNYYTTQPSVVDQVTSHSVTITGLTPGTTYYYKALWTDSDGNTGTSSENTFTTNSPPSVSSVKATSVSLYNAYVNFTISNASSATVQYGPTTSYGGSVTINTSTSTTTYSVPLTNLTDGTQYHYRIVMTSDGDTYDSDDYTDLVTLPRPRITTIRFAQVANTAQPTVLVSWYTNTAVSSIVTYYPIDDIKAAQDLVNVALTSGAHQMIVAGLDAKTTYNLIVKGRDKVGNEADSDIQTFTTATDTRPPGVSNLQIQGENIPPVGASGEVQTAQMVVSWDTDKLATSQVEFGEGTGTSYQQKTQQNGNYTFNHLVIISNLTPSKVYHLRALSVDKAGNTGESIDTVTITPKATDNALNLVITILEQAFGLLGNSGGQ